MEKYYTIREISELLDINKLQVYRYIDKLNLQNDKTINNAKAYGTEAIRRLSDELGLSFDNETLSNDKVIDKGGDEKVDSKALSYDNRDNGELLQMKNDMIKLLEQQLSSQEDIITEQAKQIDKLTQLLDQEQQLNLKKTHLLLESQTKKSWWQFWK